jgi:glycosyltransferase involved in cell wall biosynthesis
LKKAVIVNPYWDSFGGGERYSATVAKAFIDNSWDVDIKWDDDISKTIWSRFNIDLTGVRFVKNIVSSDYDCIFWVSDGSLPTSFAKKTLIHFQFPFSNIGGRNILNLIKSRLYSFVTNSKFTKSFIDKEFLVNSIVLYPPVQTSKFSPGSKTTTILYVGRFSPLTQSKNQHLLIESFKKLNLNKGEWKLVLAGGVGIGTTSEQMEKLSNLSNGYNIEIYKNPDFKTLQKLYSHATIFWSAAGLGANEHTQPLKVEHFGITVVEAMASGCVPILPNLGGHKEIVSTGEDGFLYDDQEDLVKLTTDLINSPSKLSKMSQAAILRSKIFDESYFISHFLKLI